jgi:hypothetical protein
MTKCDRCSNETRVTTMSYFNTDTICMDCKDKERKHPSFKHAQDTECEQVKRGNYNFPGIGKPKDL